MATNKRLCAACKKDMRGKWAWVKFKKAVICHECATQGWTLDDKGVAIHRPSLYVPKITRLYSAYDRAVRLWSKQHAYNPDSLLIKRLSSLIDSRFSALQLEANRRRIRLDPFTNEPLA